VSHVNLEKSETRRRGRLTGDDRYCEGATGEESCNHDGAVVMMNGLAGTLRAGFERQLAREVGFIRLLPLGSQRHLAAARHIVRNSLMRQIFHSAMRPLAVALSRKCRSQRLIVSRDRSEELQYAVDVSGDLRDDVDDRIDLRHIVYFLVQLLCCDRDRTAQGLKL
jgi:hypothetical protein